jgi:shikimate kinase
MRKLKKLSKNKKPVAIFIYGPIAVGKLTVAKILSKKLGYKLLHNHLINNIVDEIFERQSYWNSVMKDNLRFYVYKTAGEAGVSFIATHAYAHNFVSRAGLSDPKYVQTLEKKLTKLGIKFYPVHLKADNKELLRRVNIISRKQHGKLTDRKVMRELLGKRDDYKTSPKLKNNLIIDNTNLSPQKVANIIIKYFGIKLQ